MLAAAGLVVLLSAPPAGTGWTPPRDPMDLWSEATVVTELKAAEDLLDEELGSRPPRRPRILLSSRSFFEGVAYESIKRMAGPDEMDEETLRSQAKILAQGAFGYYEARKNTVHLLPENFAAFAQEKDPAFASSVYLRIVLTHELTHAFDEQKWKIMERSSATKDREAYKVWYALIEGHAQWVAGRALAKAGLTPEFEKFCGAAWSPPPKLPPILQRMVWKANATMRFGYVDGHRFFTTLEASDDKEIVEKVFRNPPGSVSTILHPTRYFVPEETTALPAPIPVGPALEAVLAKEVPGVKPKAAPWDEGMLKAQMVILPAEQAAEGLSKVVRGEARLAVLPPAKGKKPRKAVCAAIQTVDGAAARRLFELVQESEDMEARSLTEVTGRKDGRVRGPLPRSPLPHNTRTIEFMGQGANVVPSYTIEFAAGPFLADCAFVGQAMDDGDLEDDITLFRDKLQEAAHASPAAAAAAAGTPPP